jgi:hypothetical protein
MTQTKLEVVPHLRLYSDMDTKSDIVAMIPNGAVVIGGLEYASVEDINPNPIWIKLQYGDMTGYARNQKKFIQPIDQT